MDASSTPSRPPTATSGSFLRLGSLLRRQPSSQPRRANDQLVLRQQTLPPPPSSTSNNLDMEKSSYTTPAMAQWMSSSVGQDREEGGGKAKRVGIWMAGENRGASMMLQRAPKELLVSSKSSSTKREEEEEEVEEEELPVMVVVNSNAQSVNSSLVIDSTCKEKSPGVHIVISGAGGPFFSGRS